jgi:hypothetical protein
VAEDGDAEGEADLTAVGVTGQVNVGTVFFELADVIGVMGEDDSWNVCLPGGKACEEIIVEGFAFGAGEADEFELCAMGVEEDALGVDESVGGTDEAGLAEMDVVVAANGKEAEAGFLGVDESADDGQGSGGVVFVFDHVAAEEDEVGGIGADAVDEQVVAGSPIISAMDVRDLEDSESRQRGGEVVDHQLVGVPLEAGHVAELKPRAAGGLEAAQAGLDREPILPAFGSARGGGGVFLTCLEEHGGPVIRVLGVPTGGRPLPIANCQLEDGGTSVRRFSIGNWQSAIGNTQACRRRAITLAYRREQCPFLMPDPAGRIITTAVKAARDKRSPPD